MRAGLLRHRLTIQKSTRTKNDFDEWVDSWSDLTTVWGSIEPNLGKRYFEAKQANSEVEGLIRIRYQRTFDAEAEFPLEFPIVFPNKILPNMRVIYDGRIFKIISIFSPFERKRELHILYKEELD